MNKSDLISNIAAKYPYLNNQDIKKLVEIIFNQLSTALSNNNRIEIRRFASMSVRKRTSRISRNPKTNEEVVLGDRNIVYFRMGKDFFNKLNPSNTNKDK